MRRSMVFCGSDTRILCSGWPKWMQFYMFGKVQDVLSKPAFELLVFSSSECLCQEKFWSLNSTRCKAGLELNRGVALEKEMQVEHWSLPFAQIWQERHVKFWRSCVVWSWQVDYSLNFVNTVCMDAKIIEARFLFLVYNLPSWTGQLDREHVWTVLLQLFRLVTTRPFGLVVVMVLKRQDGGRGFERNGSSPFRTPFNDSTCSHKDPKGKA